MNEDEWACSRHAWPRVVIDQKTTNPHMPAMHTMLCCQRAVGTGGGSGHARSADGESVGTVGTGGNEEKGTVRVPWAHACKSIDEKDC